MRMIDDLSRHWQQRPQRDRRALVVLAAVLLALLLWQGVWAPLQAWRDRQQADARAMMALNGHLRAQAPLLAAARAAALPLKDTPLPELAAGMAATAGVQLEQSSAQADGSWQLQARAADAQAALGWVQQLQRAGVGVLSLQLQAGASGGWQVQVQVRR